MDSLRNFFNLTYFNDLLVKGKLSSDMDSNTKKDNELENGINLDTSLFQELEKLESADIGLRFLVNEETHQVMVCFINRATQKVIRSIPQDKLINLQARDLLDILA